jgi:pimeloyl-ACP methyl ester carboxylesterase
MKRAWFTFQGQQISYATAGRPEKPALLFIHGWSSHLGVWERLIQALEDDYYCIALDLIGFGDSSKPRQNMHSIANQAALVLALADHLKVKQMTLVGHSMGGQIAFWIAARAAPRRVEQVISISGLISAKLGPYVERLILPLSVVGYYFPLQYRLWHFLSRFRWYIPQQYQAWFYDWRRLPFEAWAKDRYYTNQPGIAAGNYWAGKEMYKTNLQYVLPKVSVPTLVIFGQQDVLVPVSDAQVTHKLIPHSQLVLLEECGHFPMIEQFEATLAAIESFLAS